MRFRTLSPAGTPIPWRYFFYLISGFLQPQKELQKFRKKICEKFGVKHCFLMNTGRSAMTLILQSLFEIDGRRRDEIIIPSYTCYSVPASVIKAGLKLRIADIDPDTLSLDIDFLRKIDMKNVLAIIATSLYGLPNDLPNLQSFTDANDVYLIDDSAQSMGARIDNQYCGTFGVAGLYSLDKGKSLTTLNGGVITTDNDRLAKIINSKVNKLRKPSVITILIQIIKLVIYKIFLYPPLYWIPNSIPMTKLGKSYYDVSFAVEGYPAAMAGLGKRLIDDLDDINSIRTAHAYYYRDRMNDLQTIRLFKAKKYSNPSFTRLPIKVLNKGHRDRIIKSLSDLGLGISTSYPESLIDLPEIQPFLISDNQHLKNGRSIAQQILTLPTHSYVTKNDMDFILLKLNKLFIRN